MFRDDSQRRRAGWFVHQRLADDRKQQECRYLMRFCWQLLTPGHNVTEQELAEHVDPVKLAAVHGLVTAIMTSPDEVDEWLAVADIEYPVIQDRGSWGDREGQIGLT